MATASRREDVNDEVHIVHEEPIAMGITFDVIRLDTGLAKSLFDRLRDSLQLPFGVPRTQQEEIREACQLAQVQHNDVTGFFRK